MSDKKNYLNPFKLEFYHDYAACEYPHTHCDSVLCWCEPQIIVTPIDAHVVHTDVEIKQLALDL
jgi:hypothetical protein